jgi:hypothetical protein
MRGFNHDFSDVSLIILVRGIYFLILFIQYIGQNECKHTLSWCFVPPDFLAEHATVLVFEQF